MSRVTVMQADITGLAVDAVVNAANSSLLGCGGVDGAIHRAAGPQLLEACRLLGGCPTGEARITPGFRLPASWVIHTVGPVWQGGARGESRLLADCYRNALQLAADKGLETVAFPAISTGIYGYPKAAAAAIALTALHSAAGFRELIVCCFDEPDLVLYDRIAVEYADNLG